jgi:hypothetical protein
MIEAGTTVPNHVLHACHGYSVGPAPDHVELLLSLKLIKPAAAHKSNSSSRQQAGSSSKVKTSCSMAQPPLVQVCIYCTACDMHRFATHTWNIPSFLVTNVIAYTSAAV